MIKNNARIVVLPDVRAEDEQQIQELHDIGAAFQRAAGAYMDDNISKFPKGTLTSMISAADEAEFHALINTRSNVHDDMTHHAIEQHGLHAGLRIHCLFMKCTDDYLAPAGVTFENVVDSVDFSKITDIEDKLAVCERYNVSAEKAAVKPLDSMIRLLKLKLGQ